MTQLSFEAVLKDKGTKFHNTVHYDMKQLHFRNTLKPMHWKELEKLKEECIRISHVPEEK